LTCQNVPSKKGLCEKHYRRLWRALNKEHNEKYSKEYHQKIRKPILQTRNKPKEKNCLRCSNLFTRIGSNQKYCSKTCQNNITHKKKRQNPEFKLIHNIRSRLRKALKGKSRDKGILKLLGCSANEVKLHIESQFKLNMTWDNYGSLWEIDHILPLASFDLSDTKQLKEACHYTNLQPLSKEEHKIKSIMENKI
jgi:predicted nucleic acid-binding Zn ribbon protein